MLMMKNASHIEAGKHRSHLSTPRPTDQGVPVEHLVCLLLFPLPFPRRLCHGGSQEEMRPRRWLM